ncbi:MAG: DNA topoisomerase III, partial [Oscillospiraceae bacterium]|nr:DNA topoisomerase III [Oscillospiraceae bacterium]
MSYKLVIAEKPSVAQSIAAVLGAKQRNSGYLSGNGYMVSWCFGHLAELSDASAYNDDYAKWNMKDLPIIPLNFRFTIAPDKREQFDVLRKLMRSEDTAEVINACDAGREGELIFRTAYHLAGCTKPIKRLWISSMEDSAIREGFQNLRPGRDYDGLHQSALCRARADWLVGINATRYFSLLYGRTLNIGRVMSPTLVLLVQREAEIAAFVPEPFYTVQLDCGFTAATERMKDRSAADAVVIACENKATVQTVDRKEKSEKAPALYDLTTLQRDANRTLGYTAQQTLDYLQALYEKKLCTYPRTDSRYLTDDMEKSVPDYVAAAAAVLNTDAPTAIHAAQVCNSKKVSDHHAVIPTVSAGRADLDALSLGEREILKLAARGLLRAVSEAHRYAETTVTLDCGGHSFTAKGKNVIVPGWKTYAQEQREKDSALPELTEGQTISVVAATVKEGQTTPPKHYTEDTILSSMETAGANYRAPAKSKDFVGKGGAAERVSFSPQGGNERYGACDDAPEDAERKGIGTPATRAAILEKLVSSGFVERRRSKKITTLIPSALGTALITVLPESLQSPLLTAEWEHRLKEIERGELAPEDFMEGITAMLRELIQTYKAVSGTEALFPPDREIIGKCPRCGKNVTESKKGFFCEDRACGFALWKNSKFFSAKKKQLPQTVAAALIKDGRVKLTNCWSEKTGKTYDATVLLD